VRPEYDEINPFGAGDQDNSLYGITSHDHRGGANSGVPRSASQLGDLTLHPSTRFWKPSAGPMNSSEPARQTLEDASDGLIDLRLQPRLVVNQAADVALCPPTPK
jgi:hypothetical protein